MAQGYLPAVPLTPVPGAQVSTGAFGQPTAQDLQTLAPIPLPYYDRKICVGGETNVTFTVPSILRAVRVTYAGTADPAAGQAQNIYMQLNGDTGNGYGYLIDRLDSGGALTEFATATTLCVIGILTGLNSGVRPSRAYGTIDFPSWDRAGQSGTVEVGWVINSGTIVGGAGVTRKGTGYYISTAPLTTIRLFPQTGNFAAGFDAQLSGVYA